MNRCRVVKGSLTTLAVAAIIASCGGSDNGAVPASTAEAGPTASDADEATNDDAVDDEEATDDDSDAASGSGATANCDVTIEGVGDLAYSSDLLEADFSFLDDPIGGALSYSEVDMGNPNAPRLRDRDAVEQLLRTFHERVT